MNLTRKEMVTQKIEKEVVYKKVCDVCKKEISKESPYYTCKTWNNDWGNDSCDSLEWFDICCPECAMIKLSNYADTFKKKNTDGIEFEHVNGWRH